jgi:hypothetical protein
MGPIGSPACPLMRKILDIIFKEKLLFFIE